MNISENKRNENRQEISAGIAAQADLSLGYVKSIVTDLVKDATVAKSVIDAVTVKLTAQKTAFVQAVADGYKGNCNGSDLTAEFTA